MGERITTAFLICAIGSIVAIAGWSFYRNGNPFSGSSGRTGGSGSASPNWTTGDSARSVHEQLRNTNRSIREANRRLQIERKRSRIESALRVEILRLERELTAKNLLIHQATRIRIQNDIQK